MTPENRNGSTRLHRYFYANIYYVESVKGGGVINNPNHSRKRCDLWPGACAILVACTLTIASAEKYISVVDCITGNCKKFFLSAESVVPHESAERLNYS